MASTWALASIRLLRGLLSGLPLLLSGLPLLLKTADSCRFSTREDAARVHCACCRRSSTVKASASYHGLSSSAASNALCVRAFLGGELRAA